ncbi:MAG: AEC family transporter [Erysipelotrichaceae bacterium]|nr:AEC family transporter [Erysipelotrichaceae bacterium]
MELGFILFWQIALMFVMMMMGYGMYKVKRISSLGSKEMGAVLLYVVTPIIIMRAYTVEYTQQRAFNMLIALALAFFSVMLAIILSKLIYKHERIENFSSTYSNAGFMGIPLVQATFGTEAVFYLSAYLAVMVLIQWTLGIVVITGDKSHASFKRIITNPVILGILGGLAIFFMQLTLPKFVLDVFSIISGLNSPLAMIILGVYLAQIRLISLINSWKIVSVSFVRMMFIPVIVGGLMVFVSNEFYMIKMVTLIAVSAPVGFSVAILAQQFDKDYSQAVRYVCHSTLFSIVTMPVMVIMMDIIWRMF